MHATVENWLGMSREQLDDVYKRAEPGRLPVGEMHGTAILAGSELSDTVATGARLLAWQGKVFDVTDPLADAGLLTNRILPLGITLITAKVFRGESWLDGAQTIIIDYSTTSFFARNVRDEIREIEPGIYLGKVWWNKHRVLDFALTTPEPVDGAPGG